jgi:hypothetical protein
MSTVPTRPNSKAPVDEETRLIIEHRLATADQEPKQDAREALEEIRRKLHDPSPR